MKRHIVTLMYISILFAAGLYIAYTTTAE